MSRAVTTSALGAAVPVRLTAQRAAVMAAPTLRSAQTVAALGALRLSKPLH